MERLDALAHGEDAIGQAWSLIGAARVREARSLSVQLVQDLQDLQEQNSEHSAQCLRLLSSACHVAGYAVGMSVRRAEALSAGAYFEEMLSAAHLLNDDAAAAIALTYQGDLYRRYGDLDEALRCLQTAYALPQTDRAVRGNCAQLLGRLYSQRDEEEAFARLMQEAEDIACDIDPSQTSLHGQYCLGTVYIDYSKHYGKRGETRTALEYLARAEAHLPSMPHWQTLLTATHGLLLVESGDVARGMPYVLAAVEQAVAHGNYRLLDHFYLLQHTLAQKSLAFQRAHTRLRESLDEAFAD
jgi:tetratricopeptide (TPR) repeat protein